MAARGKDDLRDRVGGIPVPQSLPEIEAMVDGALAKIDVLVALFDAWTVPEKQDAIDGEDLMSPLGVLRDVQRDLYSIEWPHRHAGLERTKRRGATILGALSPSAGGA